MSSNSQGQTRDMTQGSALSNILIFAVPLFISNFFQQCYNICDTMIASHNLGESALAAIGLTGSISGLVIGFANGMNSGYGILLSRAFGARDEKQMKSVVAWTTVLNTAISLVVTTLVMIFTNQMLRLIQTPEDIFLEARQYIQVVMGGMAATLFYNMGSGLLRAVGNSRTPLYFLIFPRTVNIAMDLLFVTVFDFGVAGIAFATVFAQVLSTVLCFAHIWKHYRFLIPGKQDFAYQKGLVNDLNHRIFHGTDEFHLLHRFRHPPERHQYTGNHHHRRPHGCPQSGSDRKYAPCQHRQRQRHLRESELRRRKNAPHQGGYHKIQRDQPDLVSDLPCRPGFSLQDL